MLGHYWVAVGIREPSWGLQFQKEGSIGLGMHFLVQNHSTHLAVEDLARTLLASFPPYHVDILEPSAGNNR